MNTSTERKCTDKCECEAIPYDQAGYVLTGTVPPDGPVKFKDGSVAQLEYADLKRRVMQVCMFLLPSFPKSEILSLSSYFTQLEAKLTKLDHLFPPEDVDTKPIASTSRGLSEGPDLSVRVSQVESESDNLSETGQAYEDAAETAAMLLEEKTLG